MTNEIEKNIVPEHVLDIFVKKYEQFPCFIQTKNVTVDAINVLTKKNKMVWFSKVFDGQNTLIKEALIDYSSTYKIMVYVKSKESEKIYKLIIMSSEDSGVNVDLLLKGLNKFYTIDRI